MLIGVLWLSLIVWRRYMNNKFSESDIQKYLLSTIMKKHIVDMHNPISRYKMERQKYNKYKTTKKTESEV